MKCASDITAFRSFVVASYHEAYGWSCCAIASLGIPGSHCVSAPGVDCPIEVLWWIVACCRQGNMAIAGAFDRPRHVGDGQPSTRPWPPIR